MNDKRKREKTAYEKRQREIARREERAAREKRKRDKARNN